MSFTTGPPTERGSVRPVTIESDPDGRTFYCEVRTTAGLGEGAIVWIELGATFADAQGRREKVGGQWRQARVLPCREPGSGIHVALTPDHASAPTKGG